MTTTRNMNRKGDAANWNKGGKGIDGNDSWDFTRQHCPRKDMEALYGRSWNLGTKGSNPVECDYSESAPPNSEIQGCLVRALRQ